MSKSASEPVVEVDGDGGEGGGSETEGLMGAVAGLHPVKPNAATRKKAMIFFIGKKVKKYSDSSNKKTEERLQKEAPFSLTYIYESFCAFICN